MRQKLDYIHYNPVKRGYVDQPEHWRYSSARNYAGQEGLIEVIRSWSGSWSFHDWVPKLELGNQRKNCFLPVLVVLSSLDKLPL